MDAELEKRVIEHASELFLMHGIRAVTMDYIATETGISKRTLYELFEDKDTLLLKTLEYQEEKKQEDKRVIAKECQNSFELNLKLYERAIQGIRRINRNYLSDLRRYHPKVVIFLEKTREAGMKEIVELMEKGMEEGYIRPELNSSILAMLLQTQLEMLMTSLEIEKGQFSFVEVFETIVMNYARGIATSKGLELIDKYMSIKK